MRDSWYKIDVFKRIRHKTKRKLLRINEIQFNSTWAEIWLAILKAPAFPQIGSDLNSVFPLTDAKFILESHRVLLYGYWEMHPYWLSLQLHLAY